MAPTPKNCGHGEDSFMLKGGVLVCQLCRQGAIPEAIDDDITLPIRLSDGDAVDGIMNFTLLALPSSSASGPILTDEEAEQIDQATSVIHSTAAKADAAGKKDYAKALRLALNSIRNLSNRMSRMTPMNGVSVYEEP